MSSSRRRWKFRLRHILQAVQKVERFTYGVSFADFLTDEKTADAVLHNFIVIGEAARHVPDFVVGAYPKVPWAQMRAMRNAVAHGYDRVELVTIWKTIQEDLPVLVPLLQQVLDEAEE